MTATGSKMEKLCMWRCAHRPRKDGIIKSLALGIYISVPFCRTKCSYCNFTSDVFSRVVFERYVDRVCAHIRNAPQIAAEMGSRIEPEVDSIYLGGGTQAGYVVQNRGSLMQTPNGGGLDIDERLDAEADAIHTIAQ